MPVSVQVEVLNVANASQSWISDSVLTLNQIESGRLTYEDNTGVSRSHFHAERVFVNSSFRMSLVCVFHQTVLH